jgi:hypothetical protein
MAPTRLDHGLLLSGAHPPLTNKNPDAVSVGQIDGDVYSVSDPTTSWPPASSSVCVACVGVDVWVRACVWMGGCVWVRVYLVVHLRARVCGGVGVCVSPTCFALSFVCACIAARTQL